MKDQLLMITVPLRFKLFKESTACQVLLRLCMTYNFALLIFQIYSKAQTAYRQ